MNWWIVGGGAFFIVVSFVLGWLRGYTQSMKDYVGAEEDWRWKPSKPSEKESDSQ